MYDNPSASQSTTSLSEEEDDNVNKSTFFQDPIAVAPAKWSHPRRPSLTSTTAPIARLPTEILIHVLRYLHTSRELYRCMLVCRTWCECSVELLWHKPSFPGVSTLIKMMRVLSNEDQAFTYARFIRRLNFCFLGPELSDVLFGRVALCVRLERLTLVNCRSLTDDAMTRVFHWFPSLVAIDLTGVVEASDRAIIALATSSKRLQGINLGGCKKVSDRGILALAHGCPLLRRVKLSGLELVTDDAIVALAHGCPLILEIDLNQCSRITDRAIRELWTHSFHMREMRLSYCEDLTNLAFPAPVRPELATSAEHDGPNPFPASLPGLPDFPPLQLPRRFDHLRMLDLTSCSLIMDEAIEGIITHAPKIRNLVLAKCSLLTDKSIESISKLGKHLHYLHLGHCSNITDASVKNLARACTRLRYIDLANCTLLTDMAVFELASLPKLRRVGLVRVNSLTDEAIYALGERYATLERIHLSYCNHITIMSIHFLLQKLPKLTHLSLTGIPAFRRPELQRFCRPPPPEFNSTQRAAFCVFSGKGVTDLREYLTSLFKTITDNLQAPGIGAEYEGFDDNYHPGYMEDGDGDGDGYDLDDADGDADVEHEDTELHGYHFPGPAHFAGQSHFVEPMQPHQPVRVPSPNLMPPPQVNISTSGVTTAYGNTTMQPLPSPTETQRGGPSSIPTFTRRPGFGEVPFVEAPASPPPPSDAGSARSSGTNTSNGAGFFRNISARPLGPNGLPSPTRSMDGGSHTPDLIFAEIGHGRGIGHSHSHSGGAGPSSHRHAPYPPINGTHSLAGAVGHPMARNGYASYNTQAASGSSAMHHGNWPHRPSIDHAMSSGSSLPPENGPASSSSSFAVPTPPGQAMESQEIGSQDSRRSTKRTFRSAISSVFGRGDGTGRGGDGGARGF